MKSLLLLITMLSTIAILPSSRSQEARFFRVAGPVSVTITAFSAEGYVTWTNDVTNATFTVQTATTLGSESNWVDWVQVPVTNRATTSRLFDPNPPFGMALIPAGSYTMGDNLDGSSYALPLHTVYVSALYMDKYEVTKALWDEVYNWATNHGYEFTHAGFGKATNHPVGLIYWYDMVKWSNARSEKESLTPCYYTDAGQVIIYKIGILDLTNACVKWAANGYRLPTEAEWEKAARGGASGHRFPWSDTDNITHSWANYYSSTIAAYDTSSTRGYHPAFKMGISPFTSPVGYFAANGYGLYDMAGNVAERCWDEYGEYSIASQTDPRGPSGDLSNRIFRGGSSGANASGARCAYRET